MFKLILFSFFSKLVSQRF